MEKIIMVCPKCNAEKGLLVCLQNGRCPNGCGLQEGGKMVLESNIRQLIMGVKPSRRDEIFNREDKD